MTIPSGRGTILGACSKGNGLGEFDRQPEATEVLMAVTSRRKRPTPADEVKRHPAGTQPAMDLVKAWAEDEERRRSERAKARAEAAALKPAKTTGQRRFALAKIRSSYGESSLGEET